VASEAAFTYGHRLFVTGHGRTDIAIDHCDGAQTVLRAHDEPGNFDLRAGLLTWDTGTAGTSFEAVFGGGLISKRPVLVAYDLANGHRNAWALPRLPLIETVAHERIMGSFGYSTHTAHDVFWIAATTVEQNEAGVTVTSFAIYAAPRGRL
jgi:hypothetical protein